MAWPQATRPYVKYGNISELYMLKSVEKGTKFLNLQLIPKLSLILEAT